MRAEERQRRILTRARSNGLVEVTEAADDLQVAPETVRRDLRLLEQRGLVRRTHGGAYPVESAGFETNLAKRATALLAEKRRIATAAVECLGDAETVFIDEGFTPQLIAGALPHDRALTVVTASLPVAAVIAPVDQLTVLLLGGRVRGRTLATVDHWASQMLAGFVIDLAFVGANGISRKHGLTTPDPAVADFARPIGPHDAAHGAAGQHHGRSPEGAGTRYEQLRELRLQLDQAGFSEAHLRTAWRETTNQDIAASVIGFIRHVALGQPLLAHRERVQAAWQTLRTSQPWTTPQRQWLERIGKQLEQEVVVDREAIDSGQFKAMGGYQRLNRIFQGQLDDILHDLAEAMWQAAA